MRSVSLLDAWRLWADGVPLISYKLWGVSFLWWGRIGRMTEFVAALSIIAEIIGPQRLQDAGGRLHSRVEPGVFLSSLVAPISWLVLFMRYSNAKSNTREQRALEKALDEHKLSVPYMSTALTIGVAAGVLTRHRFRWWAIAIAFGVMGSAPFVLVALQALATCIGLLLALLFIEPLAWMLRRPSVERWIKGASATMLILGFHFDLLAS